MSELRLTINELIAAMQEKADISDEKAKDFINLYFSLIAQELKTKDSSSIYKLGTFKKSLRKQRTSVNPRTGESVEVPAKYNISFTAAPSIAEKINKPYSDLKAVVIEESEPAKKQIEEKRLTPPIEKDAYEMLQNRFADDEDDFVAAQELMMLTTQEPDAQESDIGDFGDFFAAQVEAEIREVEAQEAAKRLQEAAKRLQEAEAQEAAKRLQEAEAYAELTAGDDNHADESEESVETAENGGDSPESSQASENAPANNAAHVTSGEMAANGAMVMQAAQQEPKISPAQNPAETAQIVRVVVTTETPQSEAATVNMTRPPIVREQIIERQVIKEQIIEQRVTQKASLEEKRKMSNASINTAKREEYKEDLRALARLWFIAGVAVVCTIIIIGLLISVLFGAHRTRTLERSSAITRVEQQIADVAAMRMLKQNAYAELATIEYGEPRLWPYIYGANRLRNSDPDLNIKVRETLLPPFPDRTLDRTTIEQSAIDAYRMYLADYRSSGARAKEKRLRAVRVIADTEQILPGFISRYELSFDLEDIQLARRYLAN